MPHLRVRGLVRALPDAADARPDAELLDRFHHDGDADAFEAIVRRHGPRVLSAARHVLGRSPDADDVFQAAFLTLARTAARIRRRPALGGWLTSVAHRLALLARTDAARRARIEGRRPSPAAVEPPDITVREAHDILHEELNRLPEALRLPLLLCYLDGMTRDEAARELGVGVEVLRGRLERGRDKLRSRLVRRGVSLPAGLLAAAVGPATAAPAESLVRAAVAGVTAGTATAAVRTLTRLGTASMILAKVKSAAVVIAAVGLVCCAVFLGATEASDGGQPAPAKAPAPAAQPAAPAPPREPPGDESPVISGRVVDEAGAAVAGAKVQYVAAGWDYPTTHTDRGGAFRLALSPHHDDPRTFTRVVLATDTDGRRQGVARFTTVRGARDLTITLRPARTATVRVRDAAKQPVAGAQVVLVAERLRQLATGTTAGDGAAVVRYPADVEVEMVFAFKGGAGFDYVSTLKEREGKERVPLPADVALVLADARTASMTAVDSADRPVAGLAVAPFYIDRPDRTDEANISGSQAVQAVTNAAGVVTFDWLPADVGRGIGFYSVSREYSQPDSIRVTPKSPAAFGTMRVIRKARLAGRVVRPDGTPAAGVFVEAQGVAAAHYYGRAYAATRADGSYQMTVYGEQVYTVGVVDDRWGVASIPRVVARENATVDGLNFGLAEGTVVRGRLTAGAGKRPVAGESIMLKEEAGEFPAELRVGPRADLVRDELSFDRMVTTDADGGYRFRVGPGSYTLYHPTTHRTVTVAVEREREVVKDMHLPRADPGR